MGNTRTTLIATLSEDPPNVEAALACLGTVRESDLTPDALTLRSALIEAADWIENGKVKPYDLANFLRDAADGRLEELEDHTIDFDLENLPGSSGLEALMTPLRAAPSPLPGPDACLLDALRQRDALVARRIAGDTPSEADLSTYRTALVALGRALRPLVEDDDRSTSASDTL